MVLDVLTLVSTSVGKLKRFNPEQFTVLGSSCRRQEQCHGHVTDALIGTIPRLTMTERRTNSKTTFIVMLRYLDAYTNTWVNNMESIWTPVTWTC
jgi:hypothetical protein